jgi:hypothetical protein
MLFAGHWSVRVPEQKLLEYVWQGAHSGISLPNGAAIRKGTCMYLRKGGVIRRRIVDIGCSGKNIRRVSFALSERLCTAACRPYVGPTEIHASVETSLRGTHDGDENVLMIVGY